MTFAPRCGRGDAGNEHAVSKRDAWSSSLGRCVDSPSHSYLDRRSRMAFLFTLFSQRRRNATLAKQTVYCRPTPFSEIAALAHPAFSCSLPSCTPRWEPRGCRFASLKALLTISRAEGNSLSTDLSASAIQLALPIYFTDGIHAVPSRERPSLPCKLLDLAYFPL